MALNFTAEASNVEVFTSGGELQVCVTNCKLSDVVSAEDAVEEFGAAELLDAIGGFEDWFEAGRIKADEVAGWLTEQGYLVEKEL